MANYIKGIGGSCDDCSANDPCNADGPDQGPIDTDPDADDWTLSLDIRLHDVDYVAEKQIHIVFFTDTLSTDYKAIAISTNGIGFLVGPSLNLGAAPTYWKPCRTSHTGNTFAIVVTLAGSALDTYSVDPITLVITQIAAGITFSTHLASLSFIRDKPCLARDSEIGLCSYIELGGGVRQYQFWTAVITGGGTGITEGTQIFIGAGKVRPDFSGFNSVRIERINDNLMIGHFCWRLAGVHQVNAIGVDNTGAIAFGSEINYYIGSAFTSSITDQDEAVDGQIMTIRESGPAFFDPEGFFFRYVVTGTQGVGQELNRLNSATVGLGVADAAANELKPLTIVGQNVSVGSAEFVAAGNIHLVRGINATKSMHFYQLTGVVSEGEILG